MISTQIDTRSEDSWRGQGKVVEWSRDEAGLRTRRERRKGKKQTHEHLRVDQTESVDDDLSLDGLDRIDNDGNGSRVELFERLEEEDARKKKRGREERESAQILDSGEAKLQTKGRWRTVLVVG